VIRPGEPWGTPTTSAPDLDVSGGDPVLADAVANAPGMLVRFHPDATSDLARTVGLTPAGTAAGARTETMAVPLDVLDCDGRLACNMCVFGVAPDRLRWSSPSFDIDVRLDGRPWFSGRATTVVVAVGQFLRGLDVVPRGHPGDGKAEIQVYDLERRARRMLRTRLASGSHLPHPRIHQRSGRAVELQFRPAAPREIDGKRSEVLASTATIEVVPGAYRLLI
jgi:hypothetical protein